MKKLFLMIAVAILSIATTQGQETFNIVNLDDELELCDFITQVTIQKNPAYLDTPFWINGNNEIVQEDYIVINLNNNGNGKIMYIEKENCTTKCVHISIKPNNMPAPSTDTAWLQEDLWYNPEPLTLRATEEDMGYLYTWRSTNWPIDSSYVNYELTVGNAGDYLGGMVDECLHYSEKSFYVEKAPVIGYVSTNLNLNLNELHWTPKGSTYDTIAIFRNGYIVTIEDKHTGIWVDPVFNNEYGTPWYQMFAIKNGRIIEESASRWKSGISLSILDSNTETVDLTFYGPDNEIGYPLEDYVQYFQLYSVESTGFGLIRSMIPVGTTELIDIENEYDTLVVAAVLWNGIEVFSNMVFPHGEIMTINEKHQQNIQIYPNPTTGILNFSEYINSEYKIFDQSGRLVKTGILQPQLNVSDLTKGQYAIKINFGKEQISGKFILK